MSAGKNGGSVASPCVGVCAFDSSNICSGCFRSEEEVIAWYDLAVEEKRRVVRLAGERCESHYALLL